MISLIVGLLDFIQVRAPLRYLGVRKSRPDLKDDVSDLSRFTSVARNPFCHPACIDMTLCFCVCVSETMIERACRAVPTRKRQDKRDP